MEKYIQIEKIENCDRETFLKNYFNQHKPVVIKDFMDDWPAKEKWSTAFFREKYGDVEVPVFDENYHKPGKKYMSHVEKMPFSKYLESIENGPSSLRLFLFNILKSIPELKSDIPVPEILHGSKTGIPFLFFGGQNAKVGLHYDIDMAHVFLSQFQGVKEVILYSPEESTALYKQPFTTHSYLDPFKKEEIAEKYPAYQFAKGLKTDLLPGETLLIPSGYWHFITYKDCSFSISMRVYSDVKHLASGVANLATHFLVNKSMNLFFKKGWHDYKMRIAQKKANKLINAQQD